MWQKSIFNSFSSLFSWFFSKRHKSKEFVMNEAFLAEIRSCDLLMTDSVEASARKHSLSFCRWPRTEDKFANRSCEAFAVGRAITSTQHKPSKDQTQLSQFAESSSVLASDPVWARRLELGCSSLIFQTKTRKRCRLQISPWKMNSMFRF